jgi:hypothetical protein
MCVFIVIVSLTFYPWIEDFAHRFSTFTLGEHLRLGICHDLRWGNMSRLLWDSEF